MKASHQTCLFFCIIVIFQTATVFASKTLKLENQTLEIHQRYLTEAFVLTKNTVGFSAPVAGRSYSYFAIAMYEGTVEQFHSLQSLTGQLNGFNRSTWKQEQKEINWALVASTVNFEVLSYLYRNMPPSNYSKLVSLNDSIRQKVTKKCSDEIKTYSLEYAYSLANEIIAWSKNDGADDCFDKNFPESYVPPICESCWKRTHPGYIVAMQPYWGSNRPHISTSSSITKECKVFEFSIDSSSIMFQEAKKVYENSLTKNPDYEVIAEFWDDASGFTGTPAGHFFSIAQQMSKKYKLTCDQTIELYVKLGIAINESFIQVFNYKYKYNLIRPISFIHKYIDPQFNTRLATPPFPEYPSGHSMQSGASTQVMKSFFGNEILIEDGTNNFRKDIDGRTRTYQSFDELAEEISISRFYGGIHYKRTLDESLSLGKKMGDFIVETVKCRK